VVGVDGLPDKNGSIVSVMQGRLGASFVYPNSAAEAVDWIARILEKGEKPPKKIVLGTEEITPASVKEIGAKYAADCRALEGAMPSHTSDRPARAAASRLSTGEVLRAYLRLRRPRLGHLSMLLGQQRGRCDLRHGHLQLVLPACHHVAFAVQHGLEADARDFRRVCFFALAHVGVQHVRAFEELVSVGPGMRQLTVTPESLSSLRKAIENESRKAFVPL
jgi:hypothetical protein